MFCDAVDTFRYFQSIAISCCMAIWLCGTSGCLVTRVNWAKPDFANPQARSWKKLPSNLHAIEKLYAEAVKCEARGCERCVDLYFDVAVATRHHDGPRCDTHRDRRLHKSALSKLVIAGQRFGRLDPRSGLLIRRSDGEHWITISRHGFVWNVDDFEHLTVVGDYSTNGFRNLHRKKGVGIPLVVTRCSPSGNRFLANQPMFAATLQMRLDPDRRKRDCEVPLSERCRLELYDPLRASCTSGTPENEPIAKDLSAALAFRLRTEQQTILRDFINPDSKEGEARLYAAEPYQPGKFPVVLIHGLFSNPFTWTDMVNDLRAYPGFVDYFQLWVFQYPTGQPFLASAAQLRNQVNEICAEWDPSGGDAQLSNAVLVGHSMGGLVAKLQVTESGDQLWRSIANRPFDQVQVPAESRKELVESFFFSPSPHVSRVVFLGTPHRGSAYAQRSLGKLASSLVEEPEERRQAHRSLIQMNPNVFRQEVRDRIPTSIDLLEPKSALLNAMAKLPVGEDVVMHSVIGDHCYTLFNGRSDGIVSVESAKEPRAVTELRIKSTHGGLNDREDAIGEVIRILNRHLNECSCGSPARTTRPL